MNKYIATYVFSIGRLLMGEEGVSLIPIYRQISFMFVDRNMTLTTLLPEPY